MYFPLLLGLIVIALAIVAVARGMEVRLTLFAAALILGMLGGQLDVIVQTFFTTFANEKFIVPICMAMGFAYALRHTGCDQHLVRLLVRPLTKVRYLLLPGTVLVGFLVNMPIISQTSTVVTIGPVLIPILSAARFAPLTIGAALLLGSSIGGELFNPGAPELRTTVAASQQAAMELNLDAEKYDTSYCIDRILPLNLLGLAVATLVLWRWGARQPAVQAGVENHREPAVDLEVNYLKALVPLVPLLILYMRAPPFSLFEVPQEWLDTPGADLGRFDSRLIGAAMLVGVAAAALASPRKALGIGAAFFEGAGFGFANIVSLIVTANCFGEGIKAIGLAGELGSLIGKAPDLMIPAAGVFSLGFATLSGSGMATAQSLFPSFAGPALSVGVDPTHVGAVVSLAAAAGRTMSPVAAVALMTARLTDTSVFPLSKAVAVPLLASTAAIIIAAMALAPSP